jgi:hypothetical protein
MRSSAERSLVRSGRVHADPGLPADVIEPGGPDQRVEGSARATAVAAGEQPGSADTGHLQKLAERQASRSSRQVWSFDAAALHCANLA